MPQRELSDRFCAGAKAADAQVDYFDGGCVGLCLRVFASGKKSWMLRYSWGGKRRWLLIGSYPSTSLKIARARAVEARGEVEAERDPRALRAAPETLRSVAEAWRDREASGLRTGADRWACLKRAVLPTLGNRLVAELGRGEIVRLLDAIADERGSAAADRALAVLRRVLNWHEGRTDDYRSPIVRSMSRHKSPAPSRVLSDDELRAIWRSAEGQGVFGRYIRFLLLTAARRSEAAEMEWSELDGSDWLLPAERNKTKLPLLRPLSPVALSLIGNRADGAEFVFSNDGVLPLRGFGELKAAFDKACPIDGWRLHDLRRTARTLLSRAGVPSDAVERCLGHVIGGVRGVYNRHEYRDEKAQAYAKLARLIDNITGNSGRPKVVKLRRI